MDPKIGAAERRVAKLDKGFPVLCKIISKTQKDVRVPRADEPNTFSFQTAGELHSGTVGPFSMRMGIQVT